jgi:hypothetical protein
MKKKEREHRIEAPFDILCWCGNYHRRVRLQIKHGYRKQNLITMLEDIEKS